MPVNFPSAPSLNDTYAYNGRTWVYNGSGWALRNINRLFAASTFGTDNRLLRADGKGHNIQSSGITIDDSGNMSGIASLGCTSIELGHASDTTLARSAAGRVTIEGSELFTEITHPPMNAYSLSATLTSSGTQVDVTGLPAGIRRLTVALYNTSTDSTGHLTCRLGTSGGIVSTGYNSTCLHYNNASGASVNDETTGFTYRLNNAVNVSRGGYSIMRVESHKWVAAVCGGNGNALYGGGSIDLGAELTQMRFVPSTGNFDQGRLNVFWEF